MRKKYSIAFKKEVIEYIESSGHTAYRAAKHFSTRDNEDYPCSLITNWLKNKEHILARRNSKFRIQGAGRKLLLGPLEDIIADMIREQRAVGKKVTRGNVEFWASQLAVENNIEIAANGINGRWISDFMCRHHFSLRKVTNLTSLTPEQVVEYGVKYMRYLTNMLEAVNGHKCIVMDETAVYFEDVRNRTVNEKGAKHVMMNTTGFSSMRVTVVLAVSALGTKMMPLVIFKGLEKEKPGTPCVIYLGTGCYWTYQKRGWVDSSVLTAWMDKVFPPLDMSRNKGLVWDSMSAHICQKVKGHLRLKNVQTAVVPGGLTPLVQAGDIGIYKSFKDILCEKIKVWKNGEDLHNPVEYTLRGNPKRPAIRVVCEWVVSSWSLVSDNVVNNSLISAGFYSDMTQWHIARHDIYGRLFQEKWVNGQNIQDVTINDIPENLLQVTDELEIIDDDE